MGRPRKVPEGDMIVVIIKDGVFIADDVRREKGAVEAVPAVIAEALIGSGHAKPQ